MEVISLRRFNDFPLYFTKYSQFQKNFKNKTAYINDEYTL